MTPRRRRLVLLLIALLAGAGLVVQWRVQRSPERWIRIALERLAEAWLVAEVDIGDLEIPEPTTLILKDIGLEAEDHEFLRVEGATVSLGAAPQRGEPLRIAKVELQAPVLSLKPKPGGGGLLGLSPLVEPSVRNNPDSLAPNHRLSEVLDLRLLRITDGELRVELDPPGDAPAEILRLDGISLHLAATPAMGPDGHPGHRGALTLGQPPGLLVKAGGLLDLDHRRLHLDAASLQMELSDPDAVARLTPGMRSAIERLELSGRVRLAASGTVDLADPFHSQLRISGDTQALHLAVGDGRLPIEEGVLEATLDEGLLRVQRAEAQMLGGRVDVDQADLAVADRQVAMAGSWVLEDLHLEQLTGEYDEPPPAAGQSLLNARGRVFLDSGARAMGLVVETLSMGAPGAVPALSLRGAELRDARLVVAGLFDSNIAPLQLAEVELRGPRVVLRRTGGGWLGVPGGLGGGSGGGAPPAEGAPAEEGDEGETPTAKSSGGWTRWVSAEDIDVVDGLVEVDTGGGAPWRVSALRGSLSDLGPGQRVSLALSSDTDGAQATARGSLDPLSGAVALSALDVTATLSDPSTRALLPPSARGAVASLLPTGRATASGSLRYRPGRSPTADLKLGLADATLDLAGLQLPVSQGSARLNSSGGALDITDTRLQAAGGRLALDTVRLSEEGELRGAWTADGVHFDRLRTPGGHRLGQGRLQSTGRLAGQVGPRGLSQLSILNAELSLDQVDAGRMHWPVINLNLADDGDGMRIDARLRGPADASLELRGWLPEEATRLEVERLAGSLDMEGDGRRALPVVAQRALAELRRGHLSGALSGSIDLADPVDASALSGAIRLEGGAYDWYDWQIPRVDAALPLQLRRGQLRSDEGQLALLGGELQVGDAAWHLDSDHGEGRWKAVNLSLDQLRPKGGSARPISGTLNGNGLLELILGENGLAFSGGHGRMSVAQGRLFELPLCQALSRDREERLPGDDAVQARFVLDDQQLRLRSLVLDLGPVRYSGGGRITWNGGLDLRLDATRAPGSKRLADLAAKLVAWRVHGSLEAPRVQALPIGVDTRTFSQVDGEKTALDELDDEQLAELDSHSSTQALESGEQQRADERQEEREEVEIDLGDFEDFD